MVSINIPAQDTESTVHEEHLDMVTRNSTPSFETIQEA